MARKPMVTRTMKTTKVYLLCLDVESGEPQNESVILPRTYKSEADMLKKAKEIIETDTLKAVHVVGYEVDAQLYGMTEDKFLANADPINKEKE